MATLILISTRGTLQHRTHILVMLIHLHLHLQPHGDKDRQTDREGERQRERERAQRVFWTRNSCRSRTLDEEF